MKALIGPFKVYGGVCVCRRFLNVHFTLDFNINGLGIDDFTIVSNLSTTVVFLKGFQISQVDRPVVSFTGVMNVQIFRATVFWLVFPYYFNREIVFVFQIGRVFDCRILCCYGYSFADVDTAFSRHSYIGCEVCAEMFI